MRPEEQMRFQGMDPTSFKMEVSEPELQRQIGNAMSLCVIERLLNRLIPAAGLANKAKVDRWESGDAVRGLEESRDGTFQRPGRPDVISEKPIVGELGEIHFWNKNPVFRYYRLPNRWTWLKWDCVRRVIHKCASSGEILFNQRALRTKIGMASVFGNNHVQQQGGCCRSSSTTNLTMMHIGWPPGRKSRAKDQRDR